MRLLKLLLFYLLLMRGSTLLAAPTELPAVAFFYGANPPWAELQAFDLVVVDPGHVPSPGVVALAHTELAAYVAVGEVHPTRAYASKVPKAWLKGDNADWGSRVIDQSAADWPNFFATEVIEPLWQAGFRSFFLDTLDSYHLFAKTLEARAVQEAGLVRVIEAIKRAHPEVKLIFNRGFEILPKVHSLAWGVAAESLFQGYDAGKSTYRTVPEADRAWLLGQLTTVAQDYKLPVISIDYVPPGQRELARSTADKITALGFIPWVATPDLATLGVGRVEVMPRRVLIVHEALADDFALREHSVVRRATMPLNYLGYSVEYAGIRHLPQASLSGRYAGIVVWPSGTIAGQDRAQLANWLGKQSDDGIPVAFIGDLTPLLDSPLAGKFGLSRPTSNVRGPVSVVHQDSMLGFERSLRPTADNFAPLSLREGNSLLTLKRGNATQVAAAVTSWGGYVADPYAVITLATEGEVRWAIDPFAFFKAVLRLPDMPVPDVTTESGRRLLLIHMDGDGFPSRSELKGNLFASEVLRDRVVRKYRLPMAISVIEGEIAPQGLHPKDSAQLESIARDIFREPNVEIASHSFSHPFNWQLAFARPIKLPGASAPKEEPTPYNLPIANYKVDLRREIEGSVRYIETRLAPPDKKVRLFLWTGDCNPGREALALTESMGLLNMNGGDTVTTKASPTMAAVEGLGIDHGGGNFQVFAPNQNENVYTNNWTGPFNGFDRVIETFELTESPRRLKPINIYFHTYLMTKHAGMASMDKIFAYALAQETTPVFASEYAGKARAFGQVTIARSATGWRIRGTRDLRTVRLPSAMGWPQVQASRGVAGYTSLNDSRYLHLAGTTSELVLGAKPEAGPRLVSANARIDSFHSEPGIKRWQLSGYVPLRLALTHDANCQVRINGQTIKPVKRDGDNFHYAINSHAARPLEALCRP